MAYDSSYAAVRVFPMTSARWSSFGTLVAGVIPMRRLSRFFLMCLLLTGPAVGVATAATTAEQLVELMKAGLSDDILIALIQTDGSTFQLSAPEILSLHRQGLSERVILAMQETARRKTQEGA